MELFSKDGEYWCTYNSEELKIWNVKTGSIHHTIVCLNVSCLSWSHEKQAAGKKWYTKSLHMGAGVGSKIIVWNVKTNEETVLVSEHSDVASVDWDMGADRLFAGHKDGHVVEWDIAAADSSRSWKAHKQCVQCVCCYGDGTLLLTGANAIKLWSLSDGTLVKKFSGHAFAVKQMMFVNEESFISSAAHERVLNYWNTSSSSAVVALTCEEEVMSFHSHVEDGIVKIAVVSEDGNLFLYKLSLSPHPPSPVAYCYFVQFVNSPPKPSTPSLLPVLAALLPPATPHLVTVAHTSPLKPSLELIEFEQGEKRNCLVRDVDPGSLLLPRSQPKSNAASGSLPVTILGPGNMLATRSDDEQPLRDRLEPRKKAPAAGAYSADSLTCLLEQSISSGDDKLLEEVLRVSKEKLVTSTIKGLSVHLVLPFLKKLIGILQTSPARGLELSIWIKTIFSAHAAYLLTVPQLAASLSGLQQLLESRISTFSRLSQLQGKLDLMLSQGLVADSGLSAAELALTTPLVTITLQENTSAESDAEEEWSSESEHNYEV